MIPDGDGASLRRRKKRGAHRVSRKRSALTRVVAVGGAVVCIGVAYEVNTPTADALSIVIPVGDANGKGNTIQINILEGNIFDPQLGILSGNVSNNSTIGNVAIGNGNGVTSVMSGASAEQTVLGAAAGNGNTIQINILSYNIFNPQFSVSGGNVSNNTTIGNVAMNNGNNSSNKVLSAGFWTAWVSGVSGNGNTIQMAFFSGNIFNPQWSLGGMNVSNNTAITNVAIGNGNKSSHQVLSAGFWGATLFGGSRGNGNTNQVAAFASNIVNPQWSFGGGNTSNNTAVTNNASGNGNGSSTDLSSAGVLGNTSVLGSTGNGNTTQAATGSGNIYNDQINLGINPVSQVNTNSTTLADQQQSVGLSSSGSASSSSSASSASSNGSFSSRVTAAVNRTLGLDRSTTSISGNSSGGNGTAARTSFSDPRGSDTDRSGALGKPGDSGEGPSDSGDGPADSDDKGDQ